MMLGAEKLKRITVLAVLTVMTAAAGVMHASADNAVSDFSDVKSGVWIQRGC